MDVHLGNGEVVLYKEDMSVAGAVRCWKWCGIRFGVGGVLISEERFLFLFPFTFPFP
jgi:hypothetical protein